MADLKLRKSTTALIAMDVQNLQVGALKQNNPERADMPDTLRTVIEAARKAEILVVHVVVRFREGYPEVNPRNLLIGRLTETGLLRESGADAQINSAIAPLPNEPIVVKRRVNAFFDTDLATILRSRGVDTLLLTGISTSRVVLSTATYAFDADYSIVFVEDCCADPEGELHKLLADKVLAQFGLVTDSGAVIAAMKNAAD
ncbi:MAG TPA: cysteine hydrolase [Candidatus Binataceae bacterium]|nr:cysteine hydrolase [Candidatus Binataceae bacterium]